MEIVTGYKGYGHITSQQDGLRNALLMAMGSKVVLQNVGNGLSAEVLSNTSIQIGSGYAINQGRLMGINILDSETVSISTGTSGSKRADIIAIRYTKNTSTGIEDAQLVVIEGTAGATYVDPEYNDNDILNEAAIIDDMPLYRVKIDGISIDSVEPMYKRWYLDTGWRTDLVEKNFNEFTGPTPTHQPAIRVIGNHVYFRGGVWYATSNQVGDPHYQIPSEFAPNKMMWNSLSDTSGTGTGLYMLEHTLTADGKISLSSKLYADSGTTSPVQLDTSYIDWFID